MMNSQQINTLSDTWFIKDVPINGRCLLAPMEGISDQPFRMICRKYGASLSTSEFINALEIIHGHPYRISQRLAFDPSERPFSIQIYDNEPERIIRSANIILKANPDIIDINMGCSSKEVSGRGAGAGLLRTPKKIKTIFQNLSQTLPVPVTGKIRLGWNGATRNYLEVAKIIEDNGGSSIAVHGRTKNQGYNGEADWDAIAEIKQAVSIPIVGNGDIKCVADIQRMLDHTNCDAVMIGRASIGNPWIFSMRDRFEIPFPEVRQTMINHLSAMAAFYNERIGVMLFRKHAVNYFKVYFLEKEEKRALLTTETVYSFVHELDNLCLEKRDYLEKEC